MKSYHISFMAETIKGSVDVQGDAHAITVENFLRESFGIRPAVRRTNEPPALVAAGPYLFPESELEAVTAHLQPRQQPLAKMTGNQAAKGSPAPAGGLGR